MIFLLLTLLTVAHDNQIIIKTATQANIKFHVTFSELNQTEERPITRFVLAQNRPTIQYQINVIDSFSTNGNLENSPTAAVRSGEPIKAGNCYLYPIIIYPNYLDHGRKAHYSSIEVNLDCVPALKKFDLAPAIRNVFRNLILNFPDSGESRPQGLLIITPNSFYDEVLPLAQWKEKKGWHVTVATESQTGTSASLIKDYITDAYLTWDPPPEYVLLIGDVDSIPAAATSPYLTDYTYGLIEGDDNFAEILVGRLSAVNVNELNTIIAKILGYEKTPYMTETNWFERSLMVGANFPGGMTTPVPTKRWVRDKLLEYGFSTVDTVYDAMSPSNITNAVNAGAIFVNYRSGEGEKDGWPAPNFRSTDVYALSNGWKLPIVTSITCYTGDYNWTTNPCFGEVWLRAGNPVTPKGAVGFIGTAIPSSHSKYNNCLDYGLYWAVTEEDIYNLGPVLYRGNFEVYTNFPDDVWIADSGYYFRCFLLLGDPSLDIWTDTPDTLRITHATIIPVGTNSFPVQVKNSANQAVASAMVSLYKDGEVKEVEYTDASGYAYFNFATATQDTLFVTVTKHNFKPYCGYCLVNNSSVYVGYYNHTISDPGGNNNGEVNPGETIQMPVTLKNFGNSTTATNISAKLRTDDPDVVITDSAKTYSNLTPGSTATSAPFVYDVSTNTKNGQVLEFILAVSSDQDSWNSIVWIIVQAPEFSYQWSQILDANGVLEPGETSDLIISIENIGGLSGNNITGALRTPNPGITITDSVGSFGNIAVNDSSNNNGNRFQVSASASLTSGHLIDFVAILSGTNNFTDTVDFELTIDQVTQNDPVGPDDHGYFAYDDTDVGYTEKPTYNWVEIDPDLGGSGTIVNLTDNEAKTVNLPFGFKYYGNSYNKISIASNGHVAMDSSWITDMYNWHIFAAGGPPLLIAAFWDDLDPAIVSDSSGSICYWHDASNHRLIVEYSRIHHIHNIFPTVDTVELATFEIILFNEQYYPTETGDGEILFQYKKINNDDQWINYATVGIGNREHTIGLEYSFANTYPSAAALLANNRAIKFTTDPPDSFPYPGVEEDELILSLDQVPFFEISPNPCRGTTTIKLQAPSTNNQTNSNSQTTLKIYDATGRLVKSMALPTAYSLLPTTVSWTGTDNFDRAVNQGVYFVRFGTDDFGAIRKLILLK